MPFLSSSPFDKAVVKATSEMNVTEDWETIMDICDKVEVTPNGPKDCLRSIVKRLNDGDPHHILHALTLIDACIKNCGKKFHIEVCSSSFELEVKKLLMKSHPKVLEKLKIYLEKWSREEFHNDPELSLIPTLYNSIKSENSIEVQKPASKTSSQRPKDSSYEKEDQDLLKAIELSLKEKNAGSSSVSLYPNASVSNSVHAEKKQEARKVRAIYDFEAAESNELTFKAGEEILVLDETDPNWWRGSNQRGEGLFPSNFTTAFSSEHENKVHEKRKSVTFDEEVKVKTLDIDTTVHAKDREVVIDEDKINTMLHLLHEADPTGHQPDTEELLFLEENCLAMGPLIDKELVHIDRRHASLTATNNGLVESLNAYEALMKDYSAMRYSYPAADVMQGYHSPQQTQGFGVRAYLPAETYQPPLPVPTSSEHFQVPGAGALPTLQSRMMQSGQGPHFSYGTSIPQGSVATTGGNFVASLPSREASGIYYGDVVANAMQHNTTSISMQHQPML